MKTDCSLCVLQGTDEVPSSNLIIETLQQIIKLLMLKEEKDSLKQKYGEEQFQTVKQTADNLSKENKQLSADNEKLNNSLKEMQSRSDSYKQKFLQVQEALIALHKSNKEYAKQSEAEHSKQTLYEAFPFEIQKSERSKNPVILAPDTCLPDVSYDDERNLEEIQNQLTGQPSENFLKPPLSYKSIKRLPSNKTRGSRSPLRSNLKANAIDPDETRISIGSEDDDVEYSIPSSPVLHGTSNVNKKNKPETIEDESDDERRSLLTSARMHGVSPLKKHIGLKKKRNGGDSGLVGKRVLGTFSALNDSLNLQKHKPKTLSPIPFDGFEEDSELEQEMIKLTPGNATTFDEIFDKTDGVLHTTTCASNVTLHDHSDVKNFSESKILPPEESVIISDDEDDGALERRRSLAATSGPPTVKARILGDSFNVVPNKQSDFKFQAVVRKKSERNQLEAKACPQCEAYYSDLPDDEREETIKRICRHRHTFLPPSTPKHFWEIGIPSTAECKRRGYIQDECDLSQEQQVEHNTRKRRRKPYQAHFPTKNS